MEKLALTHSIVTTWKALAELQDEWRILLAQSRANRIFLTPEWILSWAEAMQGMPITPHVIVVRDQAGTLAGLGLYYLATQFLCRIFPYKALRAMGDFASGAAYHDVITLPGEETRISTLTMQVLNSSRADVIWLPHVSSESGATECFRQCARDAGFHVEERSADFYCIDLPETFDAYEKRLSSATRKDLRRATRKLIAEDGSNIRSCDQSADLTPMLETLIVMNTRRWEQSSEGGVFRRKPREATFYRVFTRKALNLGWLRFLQLDADGKPAAMEIGYRYNDRYYALQGCYDLEGPPGTGKVILMQMLKRMLEEGVRKFDLLSGDFSYKQRYGADSSPTSEFLLIRKTLNTLPLRLFRFWPRGRYLDFYSPKTHGPAQSGTQPPAATAVAAAVRRPSVLH
jgi:CelD/BcsL family acetyltransferase involved in cellulose biosynthesis